MTQAERRIAITGINGLTGTHAALKFLSEAWNVRGSVRSEEKRQIIVRNPVYKGLLDNLEVVVIESLGSGDVVGFLEGCQALAHIGAENLNSGVQDAWRAQRDIIVADTNALFEAASRSNELEAVVLISAQLATNNEGEEEYNPVTDAECSALDPKHPDTLPKWYARTKVLSEEIAVEWHTKAQVEWTLTRFCPVIILGAYHQWYWRTPQDIWDDRKGNVTRMTNLLQGADAELPADPTVGYVDARDVADAIYLGITHKLNDRFLLQGGLLHWAQVAERLKVLRPDLIPRIPKPREPNEGDALAHVAQERVQVDKFENTTGFVYRSFDETISYAMGYMDVLLQLRTE